MQLEQSPFLSIVSDQTNPADPRPDGPAGRGKTHTRGRAGTLPAHRERRRSRRFDRADWHQYLLTLKAVNCASGESLASTEAQASDENHVLEALGKTVFGDSQQTRRVAEHGAEADTPLEQATTPSLAALKAFSSGIKVINTTGSDAAIPFFKRAIELDPQFALAYAYLGIMENDILESSIAVNYQRKAYELRDRS